MSKFLDDYREARQKWLDIEAEYLKANKSFNDLTIARAKAWRLVTDKAMLLTDDDKKLAIQDQFGISDKAKIL